MNNFKDVAVFLVVLIIFVLLGILLLAVTREFIEISSEVLT